MNIKKILGFNLIELLIVLSIIGILTGIAYPSYRNHLNRGRRLEIVAVLLEQAAIIEHDYVSNHSYTKNILRKNSTKHYELTLDADQDSYKITAKLKNHQPDHQICDELTIDQNGNKMPIECWR